MGFFGDKEDRAKELRSRAEEKSKESRESQWHPTEGKNAADEEDELFKAARDEQWGGKTDDGDS